MLSVCNYFLNLDVCVYKSWLNPLEMSPLAIKRWPWCVVMFSINTYTAMVELQQLSLASVVATLFFCCFQCNGMRGMYLVSYQVSHHGAHCFCGNCESKPGVRWKQGCLHCKCGIYADSYPLFGSGHSWRARRVWPFCLCVSPEVVWVSAEFLFQIEWAQSCCWDVLNFSQCSLCLD